MWMIWKYIFFNILDQLVWLILIQPNSNQVRCSPVLTQITKLTYSSSWKKTFPTDGYGSINEPINGDILNEMWGCIWKISKLIELNNLQCKKPTNQYKGFPVYLTSYYKRWIIKQQTLVGFLLFAMKVPVPENIQITA